MSRSSKSICLAADYNMLLGEVFTLMLLSLGINVVTKRRPNIVWDRRSCSGIFSWVSYHGGLCYDSPIPFTLEQLSRTCTSLMRSVKCNLDPVHCQMISPSVVSRWHYVSSDMFSSLPYFYSSCLPISSEHGTYWWYYNGTVCILYQLTISNSHAP